MRTNRGFTLIETITYGAGLIIILGGVAAFVVAMYGWYREAILPARVDQAGIDMVNRLSNDIRAADSIDAAHTIQSSQIGALALIQGATTTRYALDNGVLRYKLNNNATTTASPSDMYVSAFYVQELPTTVSGAVRVEVSIDYYKNGADAGTTTATYSGLAVLRQSYE